MGGGHRAAGVVVPTVVALRSLPVRDGGTGPLVVRQLGAGLVGALPLILYRWADGGLRGARAGPQHRDGEPYWRDGPHVAVHRGGRARGYASQRWAGRRGRLDHRGGDPEPHTKHRLVFGRAFLVADTYQRPDRGGGPRRSRPCRPPRAREAGMRRLGLNPIVIALILAVILFVVGGVVQPGFASFGQAMNILRLAAFLGIVAAGQTLVIISGGEGIDLSVGAMITLGAILVFRIGDGQNEQALIALAIALGVGLLLGAVNGFGITLLGIPPLVMTLGMAGVVQGLILIITGGRVEGEAAPALTGLVSGSLVFGIPGVIFLWLLLGGAMWLVLQRTAYGRRLFAVGTNRVTAKLSGVRVPSVLVLTYSLSGMLAALGGVVLLGYTEQVFLNLGDPYTLPSVAAVVVGGTLLAGGVGSYFGTMAGALVLTLLTSLLTALDLPESARLIVYGATLLLLLSLYGRQKALRQ